MWSLLPRVVFLGVTVLVLAACGDEKAKEAVNRPPAASFAPYFESGFVAAVMRFDASASEDPDGRIVSYQWSFGDGGTGSGVVTEHRYSAVGNYVVQLTVHDDASGAATAQSTINVRPEGEFPAYQLLDLGTLGGVSSQGTAINATGQVTGWAETLDG